MPMIVKNVYQLNAAQRRWLYKEMKRRKLMDENQKTADENAALRRRELMERQIVVHPGDRSGSTRDLIARQYENDDVVEDAIIQDTAFYCCTSFPSWDDYDGGSLCSAEEVQLEDFLQHFIKDSTANSVLEFLALD